MDFFNVGGGELIVIILLALVLFRPEDIYKAMRTLGRYTRSARHMWNEFSVNMKQEMETREVAEALAETKSLVSSAQEAVSTLRTSVSDVKKTVEGDVSAAGKSLREQAAAGAAALKVQAAPLESPEEASAPPGSSEMLETSPTGAVDVETVDESFVSPDMPDVADDDAPVTSVAQADHAITGAVPRGEQATFVVCPGLDSAEEDPAEVLAPADEGVGDFGVGDDAAAHAEAQVAPAVDGTGAAPGEVERP